MSYIYVLDADCPDVCARGLCMSSCKEHDSCSGGVRCGGGKCLAVCNIYFVNSVAAPCGTDPDVHCVSLLGNFWLGMCTYIGDGGRDKNGNVSISLMYIQQFNKAH